ncbi:putative reverse transcriptase domain-containing protein [Tanacetum coccineum]
MHDIEFRNGNTITLFLRNRSIWELTSPFGQVALASLPVGRKQRMNAPETSYSAATHFRGVTDFYQSQGYREPEISHVIRQRIAAVTYTSISSNSNRPSWGIPLVNAGELPELDPYEEVAQQGQAPPLSPAYVPDFIKLDEQLPVYVPEPKNSEYHVPSDDDIQVEDQPYVDDASPTTESPGYIADSDSMEEDSINYPDEPKDDDEDPEEDDDEEPEEDHSEEHKPEDEDTEEEEPSKGSDETEPFEEDETAEFETDEYVPTPRSPQTRVPFSQTRLRRVWKTVILEPPMSASMEAHIAEHAAIPIPPTSPTYDQAPLGHRAAMIPESSAAAAKPPRGQYDFVDTVEAGQALQASEHRMMTSIKEVNLRVRLEIDVVRGPRTAYETKLHEVRQAYLSSEAQNRALLARLETLETHMSRIEWQRQSVEDLKVRQMMRLRRPVQPARVCSYTDFMKFQPLNFKGTKGVVGLSQLLEKMESVFYISGYVVDNQVKFATCTLLGAALTWWNGHVRTLAYTQRFQELALMCTKFLVDKTERVDKYISGLPNNIHGNVMSARPKTLDDAIELAKDLMDQILRTDAERQNDNKKKADDSSRNNQQPQKKQNVARAYIAGLVKRRLILEIYFCAPSAITTTPCNMHPSVETAREACYECGNTGHIKKNCPKLKNRGNGNGNGTAQGRAYALGGRYASPDSKVVMGTFLLNNRYATILFDTGADRSFISTTFSALINITPTTLENYYDVELTDGKIIGVNTIIRVCTLNFMNHAFNIDLMLVPLGSFDVIIGMDWLTKYHGVIICDEKIVSVPFGKEMLIFQGNGNNQREESRLNIISCTKAQEYLSKGCDVFLAHITTKEAKDKSKGSDLRTYRLLEAFLKSFLKTCLVFHQLDK